jgi:threonine aldolase
MEKEIKVIDLRSDTITLPDEEMREAMAKAEVGDDVLGEDPTIKRLEGMVAELTGKEAALFVASGTMGNQVSVMTHTQKGDEIITSREAHVRKYEVGAVGLLSGANMVTLNEVRGVMDIEDVKAAIRPQDIHFPPTRLLCLENATSTGNVVPLGKMREFRKLALDNGVKIHLDGARLFNAALALGVEPAEICENADSVMVCMSKGLCAPVGSLVAGDAEFIAKARKNRKILGGGMRQAGILAAACIVAVTRRRGRLIVDHENAANLADGLAALGFEIVNGKPDINMVFAKTNFGAEKHAAYIAHLRGNGALATAVSADVVRFVPNREVDAEDIARVIELSREFVR